MEDIQIITEPVPAIRNYGEEKSQSRKVREAILKLEVGQCFFVDDANTLYNIISTKLAQSRRSGIRCTMRRVVRDGKNQIGVWRLQ